MLALISSFGPFIVGALGYLIATLIYFVLKYKYETARRDNINLQLQLNQILKSRVYSDEFEARKKALDKKLKEELRKNVEAIKISKEKGNMHDAFKRIDELFHSLPDED